MRCFTINRRVLVSCSAEIGPARLSCYTHAIPAPLSGAVPRHKAVISLVRVNLAAGELSRWLPADYSLALRSSWLSPAEHDADEKWTSPPHTSVWGQSRKKPVKAEGKETEKESIRGACSVLPGFPVFLETGRWEVVIWRWCHCPGWKMFVTYSMWNISKFIISTFRTGGCSGERREELLKLLWHWTVHQPSLPLSSCLE